MYVYVILAEMPGVARGKKIHILKEKILIFEKKNLDFFAYVTPRATHDEFTQNNSANPNI